MPVDKTSEASMIFEYIKNLTLLCVDDQKPTQKLYSSIFEDLVKNIIFANDTNEAYQKYLDNHIDIIITSCCMLNSNSLEMSEKIRIDNKSIPIILSVEIKNIDIITQTSQLGINYCIKTPSYDVDILNTLKDASKILIANEYLRKNKDKKIAKLKDEKSYNSHQKDLGFAKELNILRNDFYYQMINCSTISLIDFMYYPLDTMSGDAYSARIIDEHSTFYLMIDGMGKGLSASLTAMIMASFANHIFDKMLFLDSFDLSILIHETIEYIKPILLEEEALAIDYIVINSEENMLYYAKFAMPVLLMEDKNREIVRLKSNNPPLCKWQDTFNIDAYDISDITKFLIYSDGIVENSTIYDDKLYSSFIEYDFLHSFTREDLKNSFFNKVDRQDDDITLIYIHRLNYTITPISKSSFSATLESIDSSNKWYEDIWKGITDDVSISAKAELVFTELYMNAYEHGCLGINSSEKHLLLEDDTYFDTLLEKEKRCKKNINVEVFQIERYSVKYIITQISDEGDGFDTQILSEIFRNSKIFNGRGVFVSRKNSLGIYYNKKGNTVLYLNRV